VTADTLPATILLSPTNTDDPQHMKVVKDFLSRILASPDAMKDPSFFKIDISHSKMQDIFVETCEVERKKAADEKKQRAVSLAVHVNTFVEDTDPTYYPPLDSKQMHFKTDKDSMMVLHVCHHQAL
jgi:hypothetical protein